MIHYIAMAGLHGYLPNYCGASDSYAGAVDDLAFLHDLGRKRTAALKRDSYLELNLQRDGNEYAEIEECDCGRAASHAQPEKHAMAMEHAEALVAAYATLQARAEQGDVRAKDRLAHWDKLYAERVAASSGCDAFERAVVQELAEEGQRPPPDLTLAEEKQ